ncbi:MAG: serine/threonine-protein kinase, partial [Pseudomonadota bacterium]
MAEVFLTRQQGLAGFVRLAVVKKILPQFSAVPSIAEMLRDEARIAAQLNHPNIVQIYELGQKDDHHFIVMEYVDGCDLATLARIERRHNSRMPLRLVLRVISEGAMGLDFAHRQVGLDGRPLNIVHRDVSPHNLMCSREGAVKVTDFGIAKAVGKVQVTEIGVVKGKIQYMAPEQYTGEGVDNRSDIFSLGVVLYQLTTGLLPRASESGEMVVRRILEGKIPAPSTILPDYNQELEAIVMRALAHNPDERYQDAASLRDDLLEFARTHDLLAFPKELGDYVNKMVPPISGDLELPPEETSSQSDE